MLDNNKNTDINIRVNYERISSKSVLTFSVDVIVYENKYTDLLFILEVRMKMLRINFSRASTCTKCITDVNVQGTFHYL